MRMQSYLQVPILRPPTTKNEEKSYLSFYPMSLSHEKDCLLLPWTMSSLQPLATSQSWNPLVGSLQSSKFGASSTQAELCRKLAISFVDHVKASPHQQLLTPGMCPSNFFR